MLTLESSSGSFLAFEDEGVPFASGFGGIDGCGIEAIHPAGFLGVVSADIVLDLAFGSSEVGGLIDLLDFEHDPRVAAFADLPVDGEFEAFELIFGDNVTAFATFSEDSVFGFPAGGEGFLFVATPISAGVFAIEKEFPAGRGLGFGELVELGIGGAEGIERGDGEESPERGKEESFHSDSGEEIKGNGRGMSIFRTFGDFEEEFLEDAEEFDEELGDGGGGEVIWGGAIGVFFADGKASGEGESGLIEGDEPRFDVEDGDADCGVGARGGGRIDEIGANDLHGRGEEVEEIRADMFLPIGIDMGMTIFGGARGDAFLGGGAVMGVGGGGEAPEDLAFEKADSGDFDQGIVEIPGAHAG